MRHMPWDESLAFTVLIQLDPVYREMPIRDGIARRSALLEAWWAQTDITHFWDFAAQWIENNPPEGAPPCPATTSPSPSSPTSTPPTSTGS